MVVISHFEQQGGTVQFAMSRSTRGVMAAAMTLGVVAAIAAVIAPTSLAHANNYSGASGTLACNSAENKADNVTHTFYYVDILAETRSAVTWSRSNNYDPTEINTVNASGLDSTTDAVVNDGDYEGVTCGQTWISVVNGGGMIGLAPCASLSGQACQRRDVYFDLDYMGPRSTTAEQALACHELGHTVGLGHYSSGCMETGFHLQNSLTDHDRVHLHDYL